MKKFKFFAAALLHDIGKPSTAFIKDEEESYPLVKSLSEIAGKAAVLIASELMNIDHGGSGRLLGNISGVPPCEVVILGAGTVAPAPIVIG